jgi:phage terminase large subunit-like protein
MRYEPKAQWIIGDWSAKLDQRTEPGQLLCPALKSEERVRTTEIALGHEASAQLQQNPVPRAGGLLSEKDLRWEWVELPPTGALYCQVWDFAAKGVEATHSAVSGQLWCAGVPGGAHRHHGTGSVAELLNTVADRDRGEAPERAMRPAVDGQTYWHLVDERWGIWTVPESERQFELAQSAPMWDRAGCIIIEAKAAGIGIIQRFARTYPAIVAFHEIDDTCAALARDDKVTRHRTNLGEYTAGRVLMPPWKRHVPDPVDPRDGPGPDRFRNELVSFPYGARDDRVDSASMALATLVQGQAQYWDAVKALAGR